MSIAENQEFVTRGMLEQAIRDHTNALQNGEILIPVPSPATVNAAGGTNHYPNSDLSYSADAATVAGTLPATAGDGNQQAWRHYRIQRGQAIGNLATKKLKAVGESTYAANEGAAPEIPDWDRVNGWIRISSTAGQTQWDIVVDLLENLVGAGDTWYFLFRCVALNAAVVPAGLEVFAGIWEVRAGDEGWLSAAKQFDLSYAIGGAAGATSINYRVLAKTDSGVSILSNVLNVPNAPAVRDSLNYVKLFHNAGAGFDEYQIFCQVAGVYYHLYTIRNSIDLQYNDTGEAHYGVVAGWPIPPPSGPLAQAYTETRTLLVGAFGGSWQFNEMNIRVPSSYNFANSVKQYLRFGLTMPAGVDRHLGIDRLFFSTTHNEWAPDKMQAFADGTYPKPSVSPTSGNQGSGSGVFLPPAPGEGGGVCILTKMPVMIRRRTGWLRARKFVPFEQTTVRDRPFGDRDRPYRIINKRTGIVSEYYWITTENGILYGCNARHRLTLDVDERRFIEAQQLKVGTVLAGETIRGRRFMTAVASIEVIPHPVEVGTYTLRDDRGEISDGHGIFLAGYSPKMDRGLFSSNRKLNQG